MPRRRYHVGIVHGMRRGTAEEDSFAVLSAFWSSSSPGDLREIPLSGRPRGGAGCTCHARCEEAYRRRDLGSARESPCRPFLRLSDVLISPM